MALVGHGFKQIFIVFFFAHWGTTLTRIRKLKQLNVCFSVCFPYEESFQVFYRKVLVCVFFQTLRIIIKELL